MLKVIGQWYMNYYRSPSLGLGVENWKYHNAGTFHRKRHNRYPYHIYAFCIWLLTLWFGIENSIKGVGIKLVLWAQTAKIGKRYTNYHRNPSLGLAKKMTGQQYKPLEVPQKPFVRTCYSNDWATIQTTRATTETLR